MSKLQQAIMRETYHDVSRMLFRIAHSFQRRYNIPFEDLLGAAHISYMRHAPRYSSGHGTKISSWIYFKVEHDLRTYVRKEIRYRNTHMLVESFGEAFEAEDNAERRSSAIRKSNKRPLQSHTHKFDPQTKEILERALVESSSKPQTKCFISDLLSRISEDAQEVVRIVLETPNELSLLCRWSRTRTKSGMRRALLRYLEDNGWTHDDARACCDEIQWVIARL